MRTLSTLPRAAARRFESMRCLVGDTPLVEIHCTLADGTRARIFAKHEATSFTGSTKDRMALRILEEAWTSGVVHEGTELVEATSGNTGIAFAAAGRALRHPVRIYMPDWMSPERRHLIASLGATVVPVSAEEGGFVGSIAMADAYASEPGRDAFLPHQFSNEANIAAHVETTGPELLGQMERAGAKPAAFVAGVGTGGTVMGVGRYLRQELGDVRIHPLEPADSPTLRTGHRVGKHRIQGISDEFIPSIVDLDYLDEVVDVWDGDAILAAQRIAAELGLGVGISSGANLLGALKVARELGDGAVVATVFPDSNKKYLSTDLMREEEARVGYLAPGIQFGQVLVHPRLGR